MLVLIITALPYLQTLQFEFVFDDLNRVVNQSYNSFWEIFIKPSWPGDLYRPLTDLSFYTITRVFGLNSTVQHLVNLLLHCAAVLTLFVFLSRLMCVSNAFVASLLFSIHPINSEVVANISYRGESLSFLFGLLALLVYQSLPSDSEAGVAYNSNRFFCSLLFLFAYLSKESGLCFCLLAICLDRFQQRQFKIARSLIFLSPAFVYILARFLVVGAKNLQYSSILDNFLIGVPNLERIVTALLLQGRYVLSFYFPASLANDYSFAQIPKLNSWSVYSCVSYFIAISLIFALLFTRVKILNFAARFFVLAFALTSNLLFPIGTVFALRLAYLPSVGLAVITATLVKNSLLRTFLLVILSILCIQQASHWRNNNVFWEKQVELSPNSARAWHSRAARLEQHANLELAIAAEEQALRIYPEFWVAQLKLQRLYYLIGRYLDSRAILLKLESLGLPQVYDSLGWVELRLNNIQQAEINFDKALKIDSAYAASLIGKYAILVIQQEFEQAKALSEKFPKAYKLDPRYKEFKLKEQDV